MSSVTFSGLSSGLDTANIVSAMMSAERAPLTSLEKKQTINNERLSAYSSFNDKLTALQSAAEELSDPDNLQVSSATTNTEGVISVESTGVTVDGTYNITVNQLSQVQKTVSTGYDSMTESVLGTGSISIRNGDNETVDFEITADNNNLKDFVASINEKSEKTGVTASIINTGADSGGYRVMFSGTDSDNKFTITSNLEDSETAFDTEVKQDAQKAELVIDGLPVTSNSNTISDVIPGLEITLDSVSEKDSAGVRQPLRLTVGADEDAMKEKVNTFVNAYNGVMEYLNKGREDSDSLNSYLTTDSTVSNIKRQMQSILSSTVGENSGSMVMLSQAGISTQQDGTLEVDSSKLNDAITDNLTGFVNMFSGTDSQDGVMDRMNTLLETTTDSIDGFYATKKKSHDSTDKTLESQISRMETRLTKREETLNSQFSAMEEIISSLNSQTSYLTSMLSSSS